jgi:hypothetical protein
MKLALARQMLAAAMGCAPDDLNDDAEVGLDAEGVLHVRGSVTARAVIPSFSCRVQLLPNDPKPDA